MSQIRQQNLKVLRSKFKSQRAFADAIDATPGYVSQLLIGVGSFGEKAARKIEKQLKLADGWMDEPHDLIENLKQTINAKEPLLNNYETPPQPRPPIEEKNWNALPVKLRALIEELLNKHASGLLTEEHIKILQNMTDALTPQQVIRQQQQSQDQRKPTTQFIEMIEKTCEK